jgi:hypothetical protein
LTFLQSLQNGEKRIFAVMKMLDMLNLYSFIAHEDRTLYLARLKENAFTRKRGMSFPDALSFMLDMRKTTLQTRLNLFFTQVKGGAPISQQAFSKLRMNFDHSPFETMTRELVKKEYSGQYELPLWNGYHVFAVDGSHLQLPRTDALREEFGVCGRGAQCPSAKISVLFDVLHGWVLDPSITCATMNERVLCERHMDFLCGKLAHLVDDSIVLLDRGYPSLDLLLKLQKSGVKFLARCNSQFLAEVNNAPMGDSIAILKNGLPVRVYKFPLPSGDTETLLTNLFELPHARLPELYALRWGVEVAYFRLKRQLCVEKFSGKTPNSIRQDFWASMALLNAVAVVQADADVAVAQRRRPKAKHNSRARTSGIIVTLRDRFIFAVLSGNPQFTDSEMETVIKSMAREGSPIRPGRSFPRVFKPAFNANLNLKSVL